MLKLEKKGSLYTASCSTDGTNFKPIGNVDVALKDIKAGMIVCNGVASRMGNMQRNAPQVTQTETPFDVAFDYFRITNSGLK